jgi:hypothetical protein
VAGIAPVCVVIIASLSVFYFLILGAVRVSAPLLPR